MNIDSAINNIKVACGEYKGTLKEHQALQQAIALIEQEVLKKGLAKEDVSSKKKVEKKT